MGCTQSEVRANAIERHMARIGKKIAPIHLKQKLKDERQKESEKRKTELLSNA